MRSRNNRPTHEFIRGGGSPRLPSPLATATLPGEKAGGLDRRHTDYLRFFRAALPKKRQIQCAESQSVAPAAQLTPEKMESSGKAVLKDHFMALARCQEKKRDCEQFG
jgi:hypothetical protein